MGSLSVSPALTVFPSLAFSIIRYLFPNVKQTGKPFIAVRWKTAKDGMNLFFHEFPRLLATISRSSERSCLMVFEPAPARTISLVKHRRKTRIVGSSVVRFLRRKQRILRRRTKSYVFHLAVWDSCCIQVGTHADVR